LPPGLTPLPIVGNVLSLDVARSWLIFNAWRSTYGDIIYARLLNKPVVVINAEEVARDFFEGRSTIYSDKPQSITGNISVYIMLMCLMCSRWHLHRRILHQAFCPAEIPTYHAVQLRSAHKMLFGVLQDPDNYASHFQLLVATVHFADVYQVYLTPGATVMMETFPFRMFAHGMMACNYISMVGLVLKLPSWFPGATFKRASVECLKAGHDTKGMPFQHVEERMEAVTITFAGIQDAELFPLHARLSFLVFRGVIINLPSTQMTSVLLIFLLAIVLHLEIQTKAQAEIDRVVGKDRLPDFDDRPVLSYVEAILRETLRWHPVFPFGIPNARKTSDIYKGYFIPKGWYHTDLPNIADYRDCQGLLYLQACTTLPTNPQN
ncbi:cytochrome P450, partial [Suillus paluster]|uniref:cytochrome P450 n=1 Tax=Suillus paluster TaxID=48578 RepID=UPI001B868821